MIYIISGNIGEGKSHSLLEWIRHRTDVSGILSPRLVYEDRYFFDIGSRDVFNMQAHQVDNNTISVGRYHFLKSAFKRANTVIQRSLSQKEAGYLIIDELGKLELRSEGLHESAVLAIERTMHSRVFHLILVVRTTLLEQIIDKYDIDPYELVDKDQLLDKLI